MIGPEPSLSFAAYTSLFVTASVACVVAAFRARRVEERETRVGLVSLLATTGVWAFLQLGTLVAPDRAVAYSFYMLSLIVGLATVGTWLYFCSAYTGRSLHRNRTYRRVGVAAYLLVVAIKLTNPYHGLYFTAELVATPFGHLSVDHGLVHWIVSGVAYSLASVGLFMLYELFLEADHDTTPLAGLAAATALPVVLDVAGFSFPGLLELNYEPIGVAVFAVGTLYVYEDQFFAVQLAEGVDDPVAHLDSMGRIRAVDEQARRRFPTLADATGEPFADALPAAAERLDDENPVLERTVDDETRYYFVNEVSATLAQTAIARTIVFTDITEVETRRRELERHNAQLEGFAAAIRHNLLNALQVVDGYLSVAEEALEAGEVNRTNESLVTASNAADEMVGTVDELAALARSGQTIEELTDVALGDASVDAFDDVEPTDLSLSVAADGVVRADAERLSELLERTFEFAHHNNAVEVTVTHREGGFAVATDGTSLDVADDDRFFEYGTETEGADTGMTIPSIRMLARTHGWEVSVDADYEDRVRFVVSGAVTDPRRTVATD